MADMTRFDLDKVNVIGKLGTTVQERGLTTQQFKDKFDEGPIALGEFVNETLIPEVEAHMAESAAKHIKESGSNANGSYIRYDDGTQIAWHKLTLNTLVGPSALTGTWTLPATFLSGAVVTVSGPITTANIAPSEVELSIIRCATANVSTSAIIRLGRTSGMTDFVSGNYCDVYVTAYGRWK